MRSLGIDHLTALDLHPVELIQAAGEAGFASVSVRSIHISGGVPPWGEEPLRTVDLLDALRTAGMQLHAIEAVALSADLPDRIDPLRPLLEQGAQLGAHLVYSFADDSDPGRCAEAFAVLADTAAEFGLRAVLEPMPYRSVATLSQALAVAERVEGGGIVVDTLHASRGGAVPADLALMNPELLTVLQLCDAPTAAPSAPAPSGLHPLLHEARFERLLPGDGDLPLSEFVALMPDGAIVTVEAPAAGRHGTATLRLAEVLRATRTALGDSGDGGRAR